MYFIYYFVLYQYRIHNFTFYKQQNVLARMLYYFIIEHVVSYNLKQYCLCF